MIVGFKELYGSEWQEQKDRYSEIEKGFTNMFGSSEGASFFSAPGRTEIGGNHTDHNHGRVLTASVNLDVVGLAAKNGKNVIVLRSAEYPGEDVVDLSDLSVNEDEKGTSLSLIKGVCARCKELGFNIGGFNAYTKTRVLKGSGLSSSAAFEVLVVTIINHLFNDDGIDPVLTAKISQYAENVYFGKPSGLLDQMASSVGGFTAIDFENTEKPIIEKIEFDISASGYVACVVDTGGNHADLTDEYAAVPKEMRAVAGFFGKQYLREVDEKEFYSNIGKIRESVGDRAVLRAMHFFDDDRTAAQEAAFLKKGDFESFKKLISASGRSSLEHLQNVYSGQAPYEQGLTLALALSEKFLGDKGACRVHGGGFAGTILSFVPNDMLDGYIEILEGVFGKGSCHILTVRQVGGTKVEL